MGKQLKKLLQISLALCLFLSLFVLSSLFISPSHPLHHSLFFQSPLDDPHTRSSFCLIGSQVFKQVFSFHFHPEMALIKETTWRLFIQNSSLESLGMGLSAARVIILQKGSFSGICRGSFVCLFLLERICKCAIMNKLRRRSYSITFFSLFFILFVVVVVLQVVFQILHCNQLKDLFAHGKNLW